MLVKTIKMVIRKSKKAQAGGPNWVFIALILAVIVLILLTFTATTTQGGIKRFFSNFVGGNVNIQNVVTSCELACSTNKVYDYCTRQRGVTFEEGGEEDFFTCESLSKRIPKVGLDSCGIDCSDSGHSDCAKWGGEVKTREQCVGDTKSFLTWPDLTASNLVCCVAKKSCSNWNGIRKAECGEDELSNLQNIVSGTDEKGLICCIKRR